MSLTMKIIEFKSFQKLGSILRKFGRLGKEEGELYNPSSISIDSDGVIYVTELYNNRSSVNAHTSRRVLALFWEEGK